MMKQRIDYFDYIKIKILKNFKSPEHDTKMRNWESILQYLINKGPTSLIHKELLEING